MERVQWDIDKLLTFTFLPVGRRAYFFGLLQLNLTGGTSPEQDSKRQNEEGEVQALPFEGMGKVC